MQFFRRKEEVEVVLRICVFNDHSPEFKSQRVPNLITASDIRVLNPYTHNLQCSVHPPCIMADDPSYDGSYINNIIDLTDSV